jgi:hypothetical protein
VCGVNCPRKSPVKECQLYKSFFFNHLRIFTYIYVYFPKRNKRVNCRNNTLSLYFFPPFFRSITFVFPSKHFGAQTYHYEVCVLKQFFSQQNYYFLKHEKCRKEEKCFEGCSRWLGIVLNNNINTRDVAIGTILVRTYKKPDSQSLNQFS